MAATGVWTLLDRFFEFHVVPPARPSLKGPTVERLSNVPDCQLAIMEFDDQGLGFDPEAMDELQTTLNRLGKDPIILVFAHGWKHNASSNDDNLLSFTDLVRWTAGNCGGRPVLGVYAAWRGLSWDGNGLWKQLSFWDRRAAAQRVALGSMRELLGRLKACRNARTGTDGKPGATLVVIGHSFGGLLVYSAVAQSLIEAAATQDKVAPSFGDLVLLVNPAFSAISYLPIHTIVQRAKFDAGQLPVFVSVTAKNDWATKYAYPLAMWPSAIMQAWRNTRERQAIYHTMGHLDWMRTHALTRAAPGAGVRLSPDAQGQALRTLSTEAKQSTPETFGKVTVEHLEGAATSPFWVASAAPDVLNGHNDIFNGPFEDFVYNLVEVHIDKVAGNAATGVPAQKMALLPRLWG